MMQVFSRVMQFGFVVIETAARKPRACLSDEWQLFLLFRGPAVDQK
jgi:hypothetical protein